MSHYTFKEPCRSCGGVPSYNGHGLCDACCTGEDTRWDWLDSDWSGDGEEDVLARAFIAGYLAETIGTMQFDRVSKEMLDKFEVILVGKEEA